MNQNDPQDFDGSISGNRWEPSSNHPYVDGPAQPDQAATAAYAQPVDNAPSAVSRSRRPVWLTKTRSAVAGGAAAVLLAGGVGGFAIGRATADDAGSSGDQNTGFTPGGFPGHEGDGDHDRDGDRDGDGPGFPPAGTPGQGQLPDPSAKPSAGTDGSDT